MRLRAVAEWCETATYCYEATLQVGFTRGAWLGCWVSFCGLGSEALEPLHACLLPSPESP